MNLVKKNTFSLSAGILLVYIIFFASVFFSLRAISSISIGVLLLTGLIRHRGRIIDVIRMSPARLLLAGGCLFFLLQLISFLYTDSVAGTWADIQRKSGLLLIPLAVILTAPSDAASWKILIAGYCFSLLAATVYCLCIAFAGYMSKGDSSVFFYHTLVSPVHQHAVYFSIFVFIALVLLLENMQKTLQPVSLAMVIFFSGLLFLLSSRLVISFYILYLLYYLISVAKKNIFPRPIVVGLVSLVIAGTAIIFLTKNPVRHRFLDIIGGNLALVRQDEYTPGDYFNGVQFRLIQWKFVPEILNRNQCWWKGTGAANAQPLLNQEYISKNMYLGNPALGDYLGYRAYNTHNQPLESLLAHGIPGLLICLFIFFAVFRIGWQKKQRGTGFIIALLLIYAMIESMFETQYGVVLLAFFPCLLSRYPASQPTLGPAIPI